MSSKTDFRKIKDSKKADILAKVVEEFNNTAQPYPDLTVHELFDQIAAQYPDHVAIEHGGQEIDYFANPFAGQKTYRELAEEANQMARFLLDQGVQIEDRVAVLLDDSIDTVIVLLGILKAGAAYVSIFPDFPYERKKTIIDDAACQILVSSKSYIKSINKLQWDCSSLKTVLCIDSHDVYREVEPENELMKKDLWDFVGEDAQDDIQGGGWTNSYTGEDLDRLVMDEYGDNILHKLKPLLNKESRVLEIGCSSGISLFRLAPLVQMYYGIDLSSEILKKTEIERDKRGLTNVQLQCLPAHQVDKVEEKGFDVIIINSVIQCFNGHNYLRDVIGKAIHLLNDKGILFFGDIMDQDSKNELIDSLLSFKRSNVGKGYTTKIDWSNELFIARGFFEDLKFDYNCITQVEHTEKIYTMESELSQFRYDTMVSVDKTINKEEAVETRHKYLLDRRSLDQHSSEQLEPIGNSRNIAYITYTSGTTGIPKGSIIEHRSIVRLVKNTNFIEITTDDVVAKTAPVSFDASTFEIWGPLLNGAKLNLIEKETLLDPKGLEHRLKNNNVTIAWFTSFLFNEIIDYSVDVVSDLKTILVGGDALSPVHINAVMEAYPEITLINGYGPSENTTFSACFKIDKPYEKSIPIGKPIANSQCYILNKKLEPVAVGITGELYVSGDGLSRGYLNNPELTHEKFIDHPFRKGEKLYRTGDKAKWLPDGNIRFIGRDDEQIKVRGYRVELDEIAARVKSITGLKQVLITLRANKAGEKEICAYLVAKSKLNAKQLKKDLALFLPDYMVPQHILIIDSFPLTSNGKINRRLLPDPDKPTELSGYITPRNETEKQLSKIWQSILGLQKVGVNENFFDIGGHSLKATQLISQVQKEMDVDLSIREVFTYPTIMELAHIIDERENVAFKHIEALEPKALYAVSHGQKRMWILDQLEKNSLAYHTGAAFILKGDLDISILEEALRSVIERHEALRTTFVMKEGVLYQKIHAPEAFNFKLGVQSVVDQGDNAEEEARKLINKEASTPFDLEAGPLFRARLVQVENDQYIIIFSMHHIISDGWSLKVLVGDIARLYELYEQGKDNSMEPLRIQYKDYSAWQNEQLSGDHLKSHQKFWWEQFKDEVPVLDLPTCYPRPFEKGFKAGSLDFIIDKKLKARLTEFGKQTGTTLFMQLVASIKNLFYRYTAQEDIVIGFPIAGREHEDLRDQIGLYLNTLPIRTKFSGEENFMQLLNRVRENTLNAYEHQVYPFDNLVDDLDLEKDLSRHPLFDVMVVLQNIDINIDKNLPDMGGIQIGNYAPGVASNKFDLVFNFSEQDDQFKVNITFDLDLFTETRIKNLFEHYIALLSAALAEPTTELYRLDYLSDAEQQTILRLSEGESDQSLLKSSFISQFVDQVATNPESTAIVHQEQTVRYKDLAVQADQLAHHLKDYFQVNAGDRVGVVANKNINTIVAFLAIIKLRAVYMPLDGNSGEHQWEQMLEDTKPKVILSEASFHDKLENKGIPALILDQVEYSSDTKPQIIPENLPGDVAYIIFTSGSTGKRKGVEITHKALINLCNWYVQHLEIGSDDNILLLVPLSFDASIKNILAPLMAGARLTLLDDSVKDPAEIARIIDREGVTHINCVPSAFEPVLQSAKKDNYKALASLKCVALGGESADVAVLQEWMDSTHCQSRIMNLYGPTEGTDTNTAYLVNEETLRELDTMPIGTPISNNNVYILDQYARLVPNGVRGEICIAGTGVARGYLNNAKLTAASFVNDPFTEEDKKMYRSGDVGKWLPNGNIEFAGRIDRQVKVRGYRIEPGEIESALLICEGIEKARVVVLKDKEGINNLVAYFIGEPLTLEEIRHHLSLYVANYMIPAYFVRLTEFPLTASGKTDIKQLPSPFNGSEGMQLLGTEKKKIRPRNKKEQDLLQIWQTLLSREEIGIYDNFFAIGGDSIKALQIVARAYEQGYKIDMKSIYSNPTVAELAATAQQAVQETEQGVVSGDLPLTPIQADFFQTVTQEPSHFNQAVMFRFKEHINVETLQAIFSKIQEHHDALRITFKQSGDQVTAYNNDLSLPLSIKKYDLSDKEETEALTELKEIAGQLQAGFNLEEGPLMTLGLFQFKDCDRLLIVIHHLVVDGISWRILFEDMQRLYEQHQEGKPFNLPAKTTSFKHWAQQLSDYAHSAKALKDIDYWTKLTQEEYQAVPRDFEDGTCFHEHITSLRFNLSKEQTQLLLTKVNQAFYTEINDILLTALGMAMSKTFGLNKLWVDLEGHGREDILDNVDISRTVGWFTSSYPVLLNMEYADDTALQIKTIKEHLHQIPNKGIGYGIGKYLTPKKDQKGLDAVQAQIIFNYLGQFDSDVENLAFEVTDEETGALQSPEQQRKHDLDVSGMIAEQQLSMAISFSDKQYKKETIEKLVDSYKQSLEALIDYCTAQTQSVHTPADFTYKKLSLEMLDKLNDQYAVEDIYPLSPLQEGLLFHSLYDRDSQAYFEQISYSVKGTLDESVVRRAITELSKRHDILRTGFVHEGVALPLQLVLADRGITFKHEDLSQLADQGEKEKAIRGYKENDKKQKLDLAKDELMRLSLIKLEENEYIFIWSYHHILMDGWCLGVLIQEFYEIYRSYVQNQPHSLLPSVPYKRYIQWLDKQDRKTAADYWGQYLDQYEEAAFIPQSRIVNRQEYKQGQFRFEISEEVTEKLNQICTHYNVTLNTVIQAIWGIMLGRYNQREDVVFGSVVSGRPAEIPGIERIVGLLINTLPVRVDYEENESFDTLIAKMQQAAVESEAYQFFHLADIQSNSPLKEQLFDHILAYENYPLEAQVKQGLEENSSEVGMDISDVDAIGQTNYNFNVIINPGSSIKFTIDYNQNLYDQAFIESISGHIRQIAGEVSANPQMNIGQIELLSSDEREAVLTAFNDTHAEYDRNMTLHGTFEQQAALSPDATALVHKNEQFTYAALNANANQLAHYLTPFVEGSTNCIVAVIMSPSVLMVETLLGILKSGAAYLPIDVEYPADRVQYMLKDSNARVIITDDSEHVAKLELENIEVINVNDKPKGLAASPTDNLTSTGGAEDLAYVLYTSGSTGLPKGCMITHRNVLRLIKNDRHRFDLSSADVWILAHAYIFDFSVWEMYGALLYGAKLIVPTRAEVKDVANLANLIQEHRVTILNQTPLAFEYLSDKLKTLTGLDEHLRFIILSGDRLDTIKLKSWTEVYPPEKIKLINMYGITETTVVSSYHEITMEDIREYSNTKGSPIGSLLPECTLHVLDNKGRLLPHGVVGELYMGGTGVSQGYLNNEKLTKERFIESPFEKGKRLYKTGDAGRWLHDGTLEFFGRIDNQVKIRGYRIELGEIEQQLLTMKEVTHAIVRVHKDQGNNDGLIAYIMATSKVDQASVKAHLAQKLPNYMIPAYFIQINEIPLTISGKVNFKALPAVSHGNATEKAEYVAPRNAVESQLVEIWSELLNLEKVSVTDNFFELGGHSLKAIRALSRIQQAFGVKIELESVYEHPTIEKIAEIIGAMELLDDSQQLGNDSEETQYEELTL
ncbi:amino acid adenylation domain-containing protein [Fulvivirga sp. 29W222]|uniref:Amino acid adenylation domain-containing protein n=1 Tax=Fulvivirga marina TaxID=2494733 RepID=A0A937KGG2_9BACT|nr:non-ribosomal peptide synthetase [Fulvivirga marina]MBL6449163.1 amino acid adenylation domain-containing protein [Fulvivirga marina]